MGITRAAYDQRKAYIEQQTNPLYGAEGQIRMKLTADGEGTNFLNVSHRQMDAVVNALLTADPNDIDDSQFDSLAVLPLQDGTIVVAWGEHRVTLTEIGKFTTDHKTTRTFHVNASLSLSLYDHFDAAAIRVAIYRAFPSERCTHAHDCCGRAYRQAPVFLSEPSIGKHLSHVQLVWEANL